MTQDRIEREITIAAPIERVWAILTEPAHIAVWFGPGTPQVDLRPGGTMTIDHGQKASFPTRIEGVEPPTYLAYRWASAYPGVMATEDNSTLVEFTLAASGAATKLRVVESGFAALTIPADREPFASYDSHSVGWTEVLQHLLEHAQASEDAGSTGAGRR
jgi:uncharacterized protein YndB with AHSA1/START domain